ncbi:STAS domain-containing protein [Streptomyces sp. NBC_00237]|uniref:STAS domain-containing protein n=1 Tax=Streptomyces sp. NBC_00237 TaxID=2975687 RepID=UPI002251F6F1|nr:STAS domain-containing protein [Streptomyces sp. NBC_00237]MCX5204685.1 STAS domain-containing protein [Streptomyces sp. NBC_00237]
MNTTASPSHILPIPTPVRTGRGVTRRPLPGVVAACRTEGTTLNVAVQGEIDHFTAAPLSALLTSAAAFGHTRLVVDASRVTFCDSGFLNALLAWRRGGRRLILAAASAAVERLLRASRSGKLLMEEALG